MKWFDKLERKYGRYAIQNLMKYIIIVYAVGFVIQIFYPAVYEVYFALDAQAILHGQIWRIFTFILQPPSTSILFLSLYCISITWLAQCWNEAGVHLSSMCISFQG